MIKIRGNLTLIINAKNYVRVRKNYAAGNIVLVDKTRIYPTLYYKKNDHMGTLHHTKTVQLSSIGDKSMKKST